MHKIEHYSFGIWGALYHILITLNQSVHHKIKQKKHSINLYLVMIHFRNIKLHAIYFKNV